MELMGAVEGERVLLEGLVRTDEEGERLGRGEGGRDVDLTGEKVLDTAGRGAEGDDGQQVEKRLARPFVVEQDLETRRTGDGRCPFSMTAREEE